MFRYLLALGALLSCVTVFADCNENALQGTWTVFYRDNAFPTSVLAPDEKIDISYDREHDQFFVVFSDSGWKAWGGGWSHECINGQTVLIGAIEQRAGRRTTLVVEMARVTDNNDLLARPSGVKKQQQINIHFPQRYAHSALSDAFDALKKDGYLASHPGHSHGDM